MISATQFTSVFPVEIVSMENSFDESLGFTSCLTYCADLYTMFNGVMPVLIEMNETTLVRFAKNAIGSYQTDLVNFDSSGFFSFICDDDATIQEFVYKNNGIVVKINNTIADDDFVLSNNGEVRDSIVDAHWSCCEQWNSLYIKTVIESDVVKKKFTESIGVISFCLKSNDRNTAAYVEVDECQEVEIECYKLPDWVNIPKILVNALDDFICKHNIYPNVLLFKEEDEENVEKLITINVLDEHCFDGADFNSSLFKNNDVHMKFGINKPISVSVNDEKVFSFSSVVGDAGLNDEFAFISDSNYFDDEDESDFDNEFSPVPVPVLDGGDDYYIRDL